jgi:hypothetical protein
MTTLCRNNLLLSILNESLLDIIILNIYIFGVRGMISGSEIKASKELTRQLESFFSRIEKRVQDLNNKDVDKALKPYITTEDLRSIYNAILGDQDKIAKQLINISSNKKPLR